MLKLEYRERRNRADLYLVQRRLVHFRYPVSMVSQSLLRAFQNLINRIQRVKHEKFKQQS